jgi:hypothetical protein
MLRRTFAVVFGGVAPFFLQALDVGEGARVELQGDDFVVEAFGAPAEKPLLSLDEHKEGEKERRSSNRHVPEATQPAHGH